MLDVKRFANQLLNPDVPDTVRALNLFELYVSLFLPKKNDQNLARKYCAMFLLDHIEQRDGVRKGDLARAASLSGYCELFSELMREQGWIGLCRPKSRHGLDIKLEEGAQNSKFVAEAVDFVCRSAQEGQHLAWSVRSASVVAGSKKPGRMAVKSPNHRLALTKKSS